MSRGFQASLVRFGLAIAAASAVAVSVAGQTKTAPAGTTGAKPARTSANWTPLRTPEGKPDIQGTWTYATLTPLERPDRLGDKAVLSDAEAAEYAQNELDRRDNDSRDGAGSNADVARAYNQFWWDFGTGVVGDKRTSLIVDPSNGKVPPMTDEARKRAAERQQARRGRGPADSWEDRSLFERCIFGAGGPPMLPTAYNNNIQVVQGPGQVVVLHEMIHTASVIPTDGSAHVNADIRSYKGDSRGHWEGNTLVVDTTNFKTGFRGSSENLHLIERFTRTGPNTLVYEFTVNDPATWAKPWTAVVPMTRTDEAVYEYACHEGNYGLKGILEGARAEEAAAKRGSK